jgi:hypothetical protein
MFRSLELATARPVLAAAIPASSLAAGSPSDPEAWAAEEMAEPCIDGDVPSAGLVRPATDPELG